MHDGRTFSGKVRKLKQHRRASASRLRPAETPPHPPEAPLEAPTSHAVVPAPTPAVTQHTQQQQQQHADRVQASNAQQACHPQRAQQAQQRSNLAQPAMQQLPLLMQPPGFGSERMLEQQLQTQLLHDRSAQPQLLGQLPQQLHQQPPVTKVGRRQRPTADAAGLACFGTGVQEEQSRMSQSGPLCQPSAVAPAPVPELFEVRTAGSLMPRFCTAALSSSRCC